MSERGAIATVAAIAAGETSARAETEAAIARIEERDGPINAVVVRDFNRALAAADQADVRVSAGERLPLLGLPMTVKESFDVAGLPTCWGFAEHADHVAIEDAVIVKRLKTAGAIILGKTNVPVSLADWQSFNPVYGRTNNPHDLALSPGGSSGGAGAALASGMVALEYGSDIGGSIRIPAHFNGVWGDKPTFGLMPMDGHYFPRTAGARPVMSVVGPLARDAADMELAFDLTVGHPVDAAATDRLDGARILVIDRHPVAAVSAEVGAVLEHAATVAAAAGAAVTQNTALPDLSAMFDGYLKLLGVAMARGIPGPGQEPVNLIGWFDMLDTQAVFIRQLARLFDDFDAMLMPVAGIAAFAHDDRPMVERAVTVDGVTAPFGTQLAWAGIANYTNLPATAFPAGRTGQGLPIGLQLVAGHSRDRTAIGVARALARTLDG